MWAAINAGMGRPVMKGAEFLLEEWKWKDAKLAWKVWGSE
jgi:hypothetical protein